MKIVRTKVTDMYGQTDIEVDNGEYFLPRKSNHTLLLEQESREIKGNPKNS